MNYKQSGDLQSASYLPEHFYNYYIIGFWQQLSYALIPVTPSFGKLRNRGSERLSNFAEVTQPGGTSGGSPEAHLPPHVTIAIEFALRQVLLRN